MSESSTDTDSGLSNRILIGLAVGAVAGALVLLLGGTFPWLLDGARTLSVQVFDPLGQIFLRLLFFVVVPLVFASLAGGVAQIGEITHLAPLAARTFSLFALNMTIAVALGLFMINTLQPGSHIDAATKQVLIEQYAGDAKKHLEHQAASPEIKPQTIVDMFMPRNLIGAFVGNDRSTLGEMLPLILFAILVGAAATRLNEALRNQVESTLDIVVRLMTQIVGFALALAPYAVPAMIFSVIVKIGWDIFLALGTFAIGCIAMLLLHLFGTLSIWIKLLTRFRLGEFWRAVRPVLVTAFSTSSSNATLPTSLAIARDVLKLKPQTAGFVLPLGATMNMAGTALYEGCVVLFIAQVFGVQLDLVQQATLVLLAVLGAVAVAGIPGGSLPIIAGLLVTFHVPPEGLGIVLGVDRLLDMTRTMVNVIADLVTAAAVDRATTAPQRG